MSKSPPNFRQQDMARALRAARAAGHTVINVEVDPDGQPKFRLNFKEEPKKVCDDKADAAASG